MGAIVFGMSDFQNRYIPILGSQLLCRENEVWSSFSREELEWLEFDDSMLLEVGDVNGTTSFVIVLEECPGQLGYEWNGLRQFLPEIPEEDFNLAGRALQLSYWRRDHQFCGRCGGVMREHSKESAMECLDCETLVFPRLNPCVMVLITREDECLLAHNATFREGLYSSLAGFIEPGESVEETLHREVKEEVGVSVTNIRYFSSQPWPFPAQLMLAYTAEHESGDIEIDGVEILDAKWFRFDDLPTIPSPGTIAGKLLRYWIDSRQDIVRK